MFVFGVVVSIVLVCGLICELPVLFVCVGFLQVQFPEPA